jgi:hypothetical protein
MISGQVRFKPKKSNYLSVDVLSNYKFSICFENVEYPGYITEKIIDCFVSGVIPIYLGAPDIEKIIPLETFIDMRKFTSWEELYKCLESFKEDEALKMIEAGRKFLLEKRGKRFSFEGFAEFIEQLVVAEIGD